MERLFVASRSAAKQMAFLVGISLVLLALAACFRDKPVLNYAIVPAFTELAVEPSRFSFGLLGPDNRWVEDARVLVQFLPPTDEGRQGIGEREARHRTLQVTTPHVHPDGQTHLHQDSRGLYALGGVEFDAPGQWEAQATVFLTGESKPVTAILSFTVVAKPSTPRVGDPVPASRNRTARDVADLAELSSAATPNPAFYQISVAEALEQRQPLVVAFTTPAYCQSRLCGPVLDEVASMLPAYGDRVAFIHIEPYDLELLRSVGEIRLAPVPQEWGLLSEPYVFVVDAQGRLAAKFEGIVTAAELEQALQPLLP